MKSTRQSKRRIVRSPFDSIQRLDRRAFLGAGAGVLGGALGLAAWQQRAVAQTESAARPRFLFIYTPCGREPSWRSDTPGPNFTLGPTLQMFEPWRQRMAILDGFTTVDFDYSKYNAHLAGVCSLLSGKKPLTVEGNFEGGIPAASQRTFDHQLADRIGTSSPVRSIVVGGLDRNNDAGNQQLSYTGPDQPQLPIHDTQAAFSALFAGADRSPLPTDPQAVALRQKWEQEILGLSLGQSALIKSQLGQQQQVQLEAYESNLHEALQRVTNPLDTQGLPPACANVSYEQLSQGLSTEEYQHHHDLQSRTLAAALACGRTQVGVYVMASHLGSMTVAGGLPNDPNRTGAFAGAHHVHDANALDHYRAFDTYYGNRIRFLLEQLDSYPEGAGTVLDNTIVLWSTEIGWDPLEHDHERHFLVMFGGVPSKQLAMGQYHKIPYDMGANREEGLANRQNRRIHDVLLTIAHSMGATDMTDFVDPEYSHGIAEELLV